MCLAIPGRVEAVFDSGNSLMGKVNFGGIVKEVCLACLPDIAVGDYAIVHAGFALSKIDEASARQTLQTFRDLGRLEEELGVTREDGAIGGTGQDVT
jgi:hydrogenase expression/formation protein HypC